MEFIIRFNIAFFLVFFKNLCWIMPPRHAFSGSTVSFFFLGSSVAGMDGNYEKVMSLESMNSQDKQCWLIALQSLQRLQSVVSTLFI